MKKIIAIAIAAISIVSASFALDFSVGVKGNLGQTVSNEMAKIENDLASINLNSEFEFGGGAYVNLGLFGGLGVQAEANVVNSKIQFTGTAPKEILEGTEDKIIQNKYDSWIVDVPVMLWENIDIWRFTIGLGVGPNFSFDMEATTDPSKIIETAKKVYTDKLFKVGAAAGVDLKFYITENFGIVTSGRYICNFEKTTATLPIEGMEEGIEYPTVKFNRNSFYGGVGVELKLF